MILAHTFLGKSDIDTHVSAEEILFLFCITQSLPVASGVFDATNATEADCIYQEIGDLRRQLAEARDFSRTEEPSTHRGICFPAFISLFILHIQTYIYIYFLISRFILFSHRFVFFSSFPYDIITSYNIISFMFLFYCFFKYFILFYFLMLKK